MTARTTPTESSRMGGGDAGAFTVRPFEPTDEDAVARLARATGSFDDGRAWLAWYRANPYVDHTPVAVVEHTGDVVAALPFHPVRVRTGSHEAVAFGVGDVLVAPGADGETLAARATRGAIDYYAAAALDDRPPDDVDVVTGAAVDPDGVRHVDVHPSVFFTHDLPAATLGDEPVDGDAPASADEPSLAPAAGPTVDWEPCSRRVDYHRIQRPGAFVARSIPGPPGRAVGAVVSAVGRRLPRRPGRRTSFDTEPYTVLRHPGVPAATLAACYESSAPASVHVAFDAAFYRWWFDRPGIAGLRSYVVYRGSEVAAGLVAHREPAAAAASNDGVDAVHVANAVPVTGDPDRPDALAAGMERLLAEHADADVVRLANPLVPAAVRDAFGFRRADRFPTSLLVSASDAVLGIRPLIAGERTLGTRPIGEAAPFLWTLA